MLRELDFCRYEELSESGQNPAVICLLHNTADMLSFPNQARAPPLISLRDMEFRSQEPEARMARA